MAGVLTAAIAAAFAGGVTADPYYEYTTLLLPGTGTNGAQNNTFLDGSTNNFTITRNGNTTQGTFSPFSQTGWGGYFSGAANYLSVAATTSIDLASSDFTIECWAYPGTQTNAVDSVFGYGGFTTMLYRNGTTWSWEVGNGSSANYFTITATVTPNAWQHIALTRSGNTFTFWINGSSAGTNSTANAVGTASKSLTIGYNNTSPAAQYFTGYISNFRLTKGRAVYTGAFTPPTIPLTRTTGGTNPPQGTECSLLTCQSNRFLDSNGVNTPASSPLTITPNGSPTVVAFSPFNPTAAWSAATYGGSGYFDGNQDFLYNNNGTIPASLAQWYNTNYTIEAWVYPTAFTQGSNGGSTLYGEIANDGTGGEYWSFGPISTGAVRWYYYSGVARTLTTTDTIPLNAWSHIAFVNNSSTLTIYINGVAKATAAIVGSPSDGTNVAGYWAAIGRGASNAYFNGYVNGLRAVKGTAVYTADFTPPTAPLTAITNTSLLLNFTNAGVYDATSKNDLETVGNAQISTTQFKWGSTSIYLDGTGDYLTFPSSPNLAFGTGDYTVETWVYFTSINTTTLQVLFRSGSGGNNFYFHADGDQLSVGTAAVFISNQATTFNTNTWYHVAACRSGATLRLFRNGVQVGSSVTDSTNWVSTGGAGVGSNEIATQTVFGYINDLRVSLYARYTSNFTPPTAAFPLQ